MFDKIKYTYKIYHPNHFQVYSSKVLGVFTLLCNQSSGLLKNWKPVPIKHQPPIRPPQPLAIISLLLL